MDDNIDRVAGVISEFPGIGKKSATRIAFHLLQQSPEYINYFLQTIREFYDETILCSDCGLPLRKNSNCRFCSGSRDHSTICVVEHAADAFVIENSGDYNGLYHVLNGVLSPLDGIGPEDIRLSPLFSRIRNSGITEVIVATNPSIEGNATANYIFSELEDLQNTVVSRIASGLGIGSQIEYADSMVISQAIRSRTPIT